MMATKESFARKPAWLRGRIGSGPNCTRMTSLVREKGLHTVCDEALCPNKGECWEQGRATLMILGSTCSRACRFCNVKEGAPSACDTEEPARVAEAVAEMGLDEVVITSVTRDDLPDDGAGMWAETIKCVRDAVPEIIVEVLIPDFGGDADLLNLVLKEKPAVLGHNLETVERLYSTARPQADYARSLELLKRSVGAGLITKTSVMLGLGEAEDEVLSLMRDARKTGCNIFYAGQYLQPTKEHLAVERYVTPEEFKMYETKGLEMGFDVVVSAPLVRSSFHSEEQRRWICRNMT
jgi:lipoic acid synthetase